MLLICSLAALVAVEYFEPFTYIKNKIGLGSKRKLSSDIFLIDILIYSIWKVCNCSSCCSYHIYWISYLIMYGSLYGMIIGVISYFLTFIIKEKIMTINL
jgi:hypothetical protein